MIPGLVAACVGHAITPAPLPDPSIAGFHFPESEATVTGWITEATRGAADGIETSGEARMIEHGWGLWTALTMVTGQTQEGQALRVFETWLTPAEVAAGSDPRRPGRRAALRRLDQFQSSAEAGGAPARVADSAAARVVGFVKFDPTAAAHIRRQHLLETESLLTLLRGGAQQIPPFPASALAVKAVFHVIHAAELVDGRFYFLKAWSGPPAFAQAWGPDRWSDGVWIDVLDGGAGAGAIDAAVATDGNSRTPATTYPLSSLIHYRLSADDALALNADNPLTAAQAGDIAILVAMHVAGREIARWTWQTFWWTPAPKAPPAPSSAALARRRPPQLQGAARHYAMALAYTLVTPDQPYVGGENAGAAVYAYNPWVEARFGPADLPDSLPGRDDLGRPAANDCGVQTNCMSCHARATFNPDRRTTAPRFSGARYVDLIDPQYVGTLQVDFLWSIARHAASAPSPALASAFPPEIDATQVPSALPDRLDSLPIRRFSNHNQP